MLFSLGGAGRDTTGQALSWMTHLLSLRPQVQEKMFDEIVEVFGKDLPISHISYDHI